MENSIELIKSRLSKVTQGEWEWVEDSQGYSKMPMLKSGAIEIMHFGDSEEYYPREGTPPDENDADFIVNAKSDIEYLLKENQKLKDEFKNIDELYNKYLQTEQLSGPSFIYAIGTILSIVGEK